MISNIKNYFRYTSFRSMCLDTIAAAVACIVCALAMLIMSLVAYQITHLG